MSYWEADYRGDLNSGEGMLGDTFFKVITTNTTMRPPTDFSKLYHRYILLNNTSSLTLELPDINTALFTLNHVEQGWTAIIKNRGTQDIVLITPITNLTVYTINAGDTVLAYARSNNGQAVSDWKILQWNFKGATGPTGPTGPAGSNGAPGPAGQRGGDHDWYEQGTTLAPTSFGDDSYTLGQVVIGNGSTTTNINNERLLVSDSALIKGDSTVPFTGGHTGAFVLARGLRYGSASSTQWDLANVGSGTSAFGIDIINSGGDNVVQGQDHNITGASLSLVMGSSGTSDISTQNSMILGANNTLLGTSFNTVIGSENSVTDGDSAFVVGQNNVAYDDQPFITGEDNGMTGTIDTVCLFGKNNNANATVNNHVYLIGEDNTTSTGSLTSVFCSGRSNTMNDCLYSTTIGRGITNDIDNCFAMGEFGTVRAESLPSYQLFGGTVTGGSAGDGVGIVGRVTATSVVQPTAEIITNSFTSGSADFGEYFEKISSEVNNDLTGYFITLDPTDGNKIKRATTSDDVIGVGSATTMITGDAAELAWYNSLKRDRIGRLITEYNRLYDFELYIYKFYEEDSNVIIKYNNIKDTLTIDNEDEVIDDFINNELPEDATKTAFVNFLNDTSRDRPVRNIVSDSYDPQQIYVPRSKRPEWQIVGLLGKIHVYDDGTCIVGSKCSQNDNGYATLGSDWIVLERVKSYVDNNDLGIVRIFFKKN